VRSHWQKIAKNRPKSVHVNSVSLSNQAAFCWSTWQIDANPHSRNIHRNLITVITIQTIQINQQTLQVLKVSFKFADIPSAASNFPNILILLIL